MKKHTNNGMNEASRGEQSVCAVSDILSAAKRSQRAYGLITVQK